MASEARRRYPRKGKRRLTVKTRLKTVLKRLAAAGLYHSRLLRVLQHIGRTHILVFDAGSPRIQPFTGSKFVVLCYHRVGTQGFPSFSKLDPHIFEAQMRYLSRRYRIVPLSQMCREIRDKVQVQPTVAVTFDDGYRDLYTYAFPVLRKYRIPATIYLVGKCMETGEALWYDRIFAAVATLPAGHLEVDNAGRRVFVLDSETARQRAAWEIICYLRTIPDVQRRQWCSEFERQVGMPEGELSNRMLDWVQVKEMWCQGVAFGAHTMTHPSVARLDSVALEYELGESKRMLEEGLKEPIQDFAFPFGKPQDVSLSAVDSLKRYAYRSAVTTVEGVNSGGTDLFALRRLQIGDDPSLANFAFTLSRTFLEGLAGLPVPPGTLAASVVENSRSVEGFNA